jgi:hypothetical protein
VNYRLKSRPVEAQQWTPEAQLPFVHPGPEGGPGPFVYTPGGQRAYLQPGDWILTDPDRAGHTVMRPADFEAAYEPAP